MTSTDPPSMVTVVVTSAVVATVVGAAIDAWRERARNTRSTRLEALEAAVALEGYAIECARKVAYHEMAESSQGDAGGRSPGEHKTLASVGIQIQRWS